MELDYLPLLAEASVVPWVLTRTHPCGWACGAAGVPRHPETPAQGVPAEGTLQRVVGEKLEELLGLKAHAELAVGASMAVNG